MVGGLTFSVIFSFAAGSPLVLQSLYGLGATSFSLAFGAVAASLVVGVQAHAQLASRVAAQRLMLLGLIATLIASSALALDVAVGPRAVGVLGAVALLCAVMLWAGTVVPGAPALTVGRNGWTAGSAAALLGCAQFGLGAALLPLMATTGLRGDLTMAPAMVAGSALALAVLVVLVVPVLPVLRRETAAAPRRPGRAPIPARPAVPPSHI